MDTSAIQSHSVSDESWDWLFSSWNISSANTALALTDEWECFCISYCTDHQVSHNKMKCYWSQRNGQFICPLPDTKPNYVNKWQILPHPSSLFSPDNTDLMYHYTTIHNEDHNIPNKIP